MKELIPTFFLLFIFWSPTNEASVISCSGVVRSFIPNAYSKFKIKFLTAEGNVKDETDCNPSNGYFMIPVYHKGSYMIKIEGPDGWVFHPSEVPITINGVDDPCTKEQDINFELFGFTVSGKVRSGDSDASSRFNLALYTEDGKEHATTTTDEKGTYSFDAAPGKYVVSTRDTTQCVERGSVQVDVKDRPISAGDIRISGHTLHVGVKDENDRGLAKVKVHLVSAQNIPFEKQVIAVKPTAHKSNGKWEYTLETDENGNAVFPCLPPAEYQLRPSWSTKTSKIAFTPAQSLITISPKSDKIVFKADGFDVVGVVKIGDRPLGGVQISVDGRELSKSKTDGTYEISQLRSGKHTIEGSLKHFAFDKQNVQIDISKSDLPPLQATKVEVCGTVNVEDSTMLYDSNSVIEVSSKNNAEERVRLDQQTGSFCVFLSPGSYKFKPLLSGARLNPEFVDVNVKDSPISDLIFTEFRATINGRVQCLGSNDCADSKVQLVLNGNVVETISVEKSGVFSFKSVSPGNYILRIDGKNTACWEEEELSARIVSTDISNVYFKQVGYRVNIHSPKAANLKWSGPGGSGHNAVEAGLRSTFCVPKAGTYRFSLESCHQFKQPNPFDYAIPSDSPLTLEPQKAHFSASIVLSERTVAPDSFKLTLRSNNFEQQLSAQQGRSASNHSFVTWIDQSLQGDKFTITPISDKHLFSPLTHEFVFDGECTFNSVSFRAVEGKFVTGTIEPPVRDVQVKATNKGNGEVMEGKTDGSGKFSIGPVWDPNVYSVELHLEGFKFTPTATKNNFKSTRLSKLELTYVDETNKKPLPEVLVSLSGGENYRSNSVVNQNGQHVFVGLPAGEYYIRSVLREYKFEPTSTVVKIKEGETVSLKLEGKRYAYSAFGKVSTAGGVAVEQVTVEAISKQCGNLQEEEVTDNKGAFRIRGLKPKCRYSVYLRTADGKLPSIPPFIEIDTEERDQSGLEFTTMAAVQSNEVFGRVNCDEGIKCGAMRVEMFEDGNLKSHVQLAASERVFFFTNMISPNQEYRVSISDSDLRSIDAASNSVRFNGNTPTQTVILNVVPRERRPEIETTRSSVFGILFVIISTLVFLNLNASRELLVAFIDRTRSIILQHREGSPFSPDRKRKARKNN